ncbi:MAG: cyclic nucleotide-binding domain-containing protein [Deltaproteobacteria bacterium]|nr:cyclic nucleotide-binding domain-containing protein [Deltaproteobacteria bacterium]
MASIVKLKEKARNYRNAGKLAKAATVYAQLAKLEPKNARWPHKLGELEQRLGKPGLAVAAFEQAVALHAKGGFLLKAIALCRQILAIDEEHERTQTMLAELYAKNGGGVPQPMRSPKRAASQASAGEGLQAPPTGPVPAARRQGLRPMATGPVAPVRRQGLRPVATGPVAPVRSSGLNAVPTGPARPSAPPPPRMAAPIVPPPVSPVSPDPDPMLELEPGTPPAEGQQSDISIALGESLDVLQLSDVLEGTSTPTPVSDSVGGPGVFQVSLDETGRGHPPVVTPRAPAIDELPPTPLFSALEPDALRSLIEKVEVRQLEPGDVIVREGTEGGGLFVLVEGRVLVYRGAPRQELGHLEEGAFFGEIALVSRRLRTASVEALEACTLLEISREVVSTLIETYPTVLKVLLRFFRECLVNTLVQTHRLFAPFSGDDRQALAQRFDFLEVESDTRLAICGGRADGLYVVLSGRLIGENEHGATFELATGDVFGEDSLLGTGPSPFSVSARTRAWLLRLNERAFREVIMTHPHVLEVVTSLANDDLQEDGRVGAESMFVVL